MINEARIRLGIQFRPAWDPGCLYLPCRHYLGARNFCRRSQVMLEKHVQHCRQCDLGHNKLTTVYKKKCAAWLDEDDADLSYQLNKMMVLMNLILCLLEHFYHKMIEAVSKKYTIIFSFRFRPTAGSQNTMDCGPNRGRVKASGRVPKISISGCPLQRNYKAQFAYSKYTV